MRIMAEVHHTLPSTKHLSSTEWKIRLEGRLLCTLSEEELLTQESKKFLNFFERIKVEFPDNEELYPPVEWIKAKSSAGAAFDSFEISRSINKDQKKRLANGIVKVKITLHLESNPRRYRLSSSLSRVLGGIEEASRI